MTKRSAIVYSKGSSWAHNNELCALLKQHGWHCGRSNVKYVGFRIILKRKKLIDKDTKVHCKGGSWFLNIKGCKSGINFECPLNFYTNDVGFRITLRRKNAS